jgi:uncharacterized membrane protein YgcG
VDFLLDNWALFLILAALGGIGYLVYRRVMRSLTPLQLTHTIDPDDVVISPPTLPTDTFDSTAKDSSSTSSSPSDSSDGGFSGGGGSFGGGGASGNW